jgi:hypothetical protein
LLSAFLSFLICTVGSPEILETSLISLCSSLSLS